MRDATASLIGRFTGDGPVEWHMRARAVSVSSEFPKGDDASSSISPPSRASLVNNPWSARNSSTAKSARGSLMGARARHPPWRGRAGARAWQLSGNAFERLPKNRDRFWKH